MTKKSRIQFDRNVKCLINQYSQIDVKLNGAIVQIDGDNTKVDYAMHNIINRKFPGRKYCGCCRN